VVRRAKHGVASVGAALGLGLMVWVGPATAGTPLAPPTAADVTVADDALSASLRRDIALGHYDDALSRLSARPDVLATDAGVHLQARLLLETGKPVTALGVLEAHLSRHPDDADGRFLLGEIYFRRGRVRQAALEYRLAMAGRLDEAKASVARARLEEISLPKAWRFGYGVALSANSAADGTSDDGRTPLNGLPAAPYDGSQKRSAVSATVAVRADKTNALQDGLALHTTVLAIGSTGTASAYDTESVSIQSGPEWSLDSLTHVSVSPRLLAEWVGGKTALSGSGLVLNGDTYGGNALWVSQVSADSFKIRYDSLGHGTNTRLMVRRTHYLNPSALWSADAVVGRIDASLVSGPYSEGQVRIGRLFSAPLSSLVYVEATGRVRNYDEDAATGDIGRRDHFAQLSFRFTKRNMMIYSGIPFIALSAAHNQSTIAAHRYSRMRFDFGFTRGF